MITTEFKVTIRPKVSSPVEFFNSGLRGAGAGWRSEMARYPRSTSDYRRTHTMGDKSTFRITQSGEKAEFQSTGYARYPLFGTGIYGSKNTPIVPVSKPFLAWKSPSGSWVFAKSVKGYIWEGKLDAVKKAIINGFKQSLKSFPQGGSDG